MKFDKVNIFRQKMCKKKNSQKITFFRGGRPYKKTHFAQQLFAQVSDRNKIIFLNLFFFFFLFFLGAPSLSIAKKVKNVPGS